MRPTSKGSIMPPSGDRAAAAGSAPSVSAMVCDPPADGAWSLMAGLLFFYKPECCLQFLSKLHDGAQTEHSGVPERRTRQVARERARRAAARMQDVLKVRLQRPAAANLILVDRGDEALIAARRPERAVEVLEILIERARPWRDMRTGDGNAELVLGT